MPWLHGFAFPSQSDGNPPALTCRRSFAPKRLPVGELRGGKERATPSRFRYAWPGSRLVLEGSELTCSDIVTVAQCSGRGG
jgi:hypothetical protein